MAGKLIFSFDFECGWGVIGNGRWKRREAAGVYRDLRPALAKFIAQLDALEFAFDWFPVGAMIVGDAARSLDHLPGEYGTLARAFAAEAEPQTKDGRDLLDMVLNARVKHRFGTHSYSHVLFDDPALDAMAIAAELALARAANQSAGIAADRLVFPENRWAHLDEVHRTGINAVRMPAIGGQSARGIVDLGRKVFAGTPAAKDRTDPKTGLVLHHGSMLFNWGVDSTLARKILVRRRLWAGLSAAKKGATVHYWLHPFNLVETRDLFDIATDFLVAAGKLRDQGRIEIAGFPGGAE